MVDDVMSAGSALRGTYAELRAHGAVPLVAGALLVLGSAGAGFFAEQGVAVEAVARDEYELWLPAACPLCAAGVPLEDVASPAAEQVDSTTVSRCRDSPPILIFPIEKPGCTTEPRRARRTEKIKSPCPPCLRGASASGPGLTAVRTHRVPSGAELQRW